MSATPLNNFYKKRHNPFIQEVSLIARSNFYKVLPSFRFGFELETQNLVNRECNDYRNAISYEAERYDMDAYQQAKAESWTRLCNTMFRDPDLRHIYTYVIDGVGDHATLEKFIRHQFPRRYSSSFFTADRISKIKDILQNEACVLTYGMYKDWLLRTRPHHRATVNTNRRLSYLIESHNGFGYGSSELNRQLNANNPFFTDKESFRIVNRVPVERFSNVNEYYTRHVGTFLETIGEAPYVPHVEYGTDATVKGPEVRTRGGLPFNHIRSAIKALSKVPMSVDNQCSFHVHFSVSEVAMPRYDKEFHLALYEGLLNHLHELPQNVKNRIAQKNWRNRYFGFRICSDKYAAIAWRSNTWEFRCFGGVSSYEDQLKCILAAAKSFHWACKAYTGKERRFLTSEDQLTDGSYYSKAIDRVVAGKSPTVFTSVVRQLREESLQTTHYEPRRNPSWVELPSYPIRSNPFNTEHLIDSDAGTVTAHSHEPVPTPTCANNEPDSAHLMNEISQILQGLADRPLTMNHSTDTIQYNNGLAPYMWGVAEQTANEIELSPDLVLEARGA
jgi:hypothetical protein